MEKHKENYNEMGIIQCENRGVKYSYEVMNVPQNDYELFNAVYRDIADKLGIDTAIEIYQMFKGQQITFPVRLLNPARIQLNIIREYNGSNIKALAVKYNYSERMIRKIIQDSVAEE